MGDSLMVKPQSSKLLLWVRFLLSQMSVMYLIMYILIILILINFNFKKEYIIFLPKILLLNNFKKEFIVFFYTTIYYIKKINFFSLKYRYTRVNLSFNRLPYKCFVLR